MHPEDGKLGTDLHPDDKRYVLAAYVHRNPLIPDAVWLANTRFCVRKDGRLDARTRACYSRVYADRNGRLFFDGQSANRRDHGGSTHE